MQLFQYMFYRIYKLYYNWGEGNAAIPATIITSACMTSNLVTIIPFIFSVKYNNWLFIIICILLITLNKKWLTDNILLQKYDEQWKQEKKNIKRIKGILIILYIIGSFAAYVKAIGYYSEDTNWRWEL